MKDRLHIQRPRTVQSPPTRTLDTLPVTRTGSGVGVQIYLSIAWNVNKGLKTKLDNLDFVEHIIKYDIIILLECWINQHDCLDLTHSLNPLCAIRCLRRLQGFPPGSVCSNSRCCLHGQASAFKIFKGSSSPGLLWPASISFSLGCPS